MATQTPTVIISVISDLATDQRVNRAAMTLHRKGFDVLLVGRRLKHSLPAGDRPYKTKRFKLLFERGPLFYAAFNIRLFFFLFFKKSDILLANDLDTLLANYLVAKFRRVKLVYDSHEYFTEVPELTARPAVRSIWLFIERWIFPKLDRVMTVNASIAAIYRQQYGVGVRIVRNLPYRQGDLPGENRKAWNLPEDQTIFLFQGAGINVDRGAEEAIEAIQQVDGAVLLFLGGGDVINRLKAQVAAGKASGKVFFIPRQPMNELIRFTTLADFGLTLDKDSNLNYRYSLPNKLFDYIQAGLPVLATDLAEVKKIVLDYDIGLITPSPEPHILAGKMREMMRDENRLARWKKNLNIAAAELCWEKE
jgi:glycosyltransferase involved in cell wall biosynthesis